MAPVLRAVLPRIEDAPARPFAPEETGERFIGPIAAGNSGELVVVVVDADDVGCNALPPVVADDRASRVECLGQVVQGLDIVPLGRIVGQVRDAPRLIERHPGDDARVAAIALDRLSPFAPSVARQRSALNR